MSANWGGIDEGTRNYPAIADLDNDGLLDLVTGNQRGGRAPTTPTGTAPPRQRTRPHRHRFRFNFRPNPAGDRVYAGVVLPGRLFGGRYLIRWVSK